MPSRRGLLPTGGPLNGLNERAKVNSRARSVPIMRLVGAHKPQTPREVSRLIEEHVCPATPCATCGVVSQGTVDTFASNLFLAQFAEAGFVAQHGRFSYARCHEFTHALFCVAPIMGYSREVQSRREVWNALQQTRVDDDDGGDGGDARAWHVRDPTEEEDAGCAVDYVVGRIDDAGTVEDLVGVQVKPASCAPGVLASNAKKQRRCAFPTVFHIYDAQGHFDLGETDAIAAEVVRVARERDADAPPAPPAITSS